MKVNWKRNLFVSWLGCFFVGASFSLVMPFMPLYIEHLGVHGAAVNFYAGLTFSLTALASALIAPVWGRLADQHGRKPMMVRAAVVMTICMGGVAFVPNVFWLLGLRTLMGFFSGYIPNSTALVAAQAPRDKSGYALGTLSTALVTGTLIGPSLGGLLAQWFGMANVFLIVGGLLLIVTLLTIFAVHEDFEPVTRDALLSTKEIMSRVSNRQILIGLFVTSFILQVTTQSIEPFVTLYIRTLSHDTSNLMFISGLVVSAVGLSAMMSSSTLGKLGDKYGGHRLILIGLIFSFVVYVPMAFVGNPLELGILRFLLGFGSGALLPAVNSLLSKITPKEGVSRIFAFNQMAGNLGMVTGPLVGSAIAGTMGYREAFIGTSLFVIVNFVWSFVNFRPYLRKSSIVATAKTDGS
ncbi:MAG: multidrug efflux MFS transporter [Streptococcaceae bacterium]|jgi:MFS family permease|nr:multidrug efflux MFS transporter [Streptococcaceae bacterium]